MTTLDPSLLKQFKDFALEVGVEAGKTIKPIYEAPVEFEKKADLSPVSLADRESERLIRERIRRRFPEHRIKGEEFPDEGPKDAEFIWHIDPIDGTLMFIRQLPYWGSVIGIEYQGRVIAGAVTYPILDMAMAAAEGLGCELNGKPVQVSKKTKLSEACVLYNSFLNCGHDHQQKLLKLFSKTYDARGFGDCYAHALLVCGKVDAVIDAKISPYDVSAIQICVKEAGGQFSDWSGVDHIYGPEALSSNGILHDQLLRELRSPQ